MTCPQCGAGPIPTDGHYCHACGAKLPSAPLVVRAGNPVADGSERALQQLVWTTRLEWVQTHKTRVAVYAAGAAVAVTVAAVVAIVVVSLAIAAVAVASPFVAFIAALYVIGRARRRHWVRL